VQNFFFLSLIFGGEVVSLYVYVEHLGFSYFLNHWTLPRGLKGAKTLNTNIKHILYYKYKAVVLFLEGFSSLAYRLWVRLRAYPRVEQLKGASLR
jgi:hypothetical protein